MKMGPNALVSLVICFATTSALSQSSLPETPAGRVFAAWLEAFNSGDREQMREFDETHGGARSLQRLLGLRERTGGFVVLRLENHEERSLSALVQENDGDAVARFLLEVSSDVPPRIVDWDLRVTARPADLSIQRLSEADALEALSARVDSAVDADQFSGVIVVVRDGEVLFERAAGSADREGDISVRHDSQFRLGSMNKMFTAIATLQLIRAGRLTLDDTIGKHLSDYPNKDVARVTLRQLLTHTGGTGDIFGPSFTEHRLTLRSHQDYLNLYGTRSLSHEPGMEHRYSNYGFILLGAIIESVTGDSYYDFVRSQIFGPAEMDSTGSLPESDLVPRRAKGYTRRDGTWQSNAETLPWRGTAAGGGYSTVGDLLRFAEALESGSLLSAELMAEATEPQSEQYGYGFSVRGEGLARSYGHGGGAPGMNGELRVFPRLGYVLVGLSNLDPPAASRLVEFIANRLPTSP